MRRIYIAKQAREHQAEGAGCDDVSAESLATALLNIYSLKQTTQKALLAEPYTGFYELLQFDTSVAPTPAAPAPPVTRAATASVLPEWLRKPLGEEGCRELESSLGEVLSPDEVPVWPPDFQDPMGACLWCLAQLVGGLVERREEGREKAALLARLQLRERETTDRLIAAEKAIAAEMESDLSAMRDENTALRLRAWEAERLAQDRMVAFQTCRDITSDLFDRLQHPLND